MTNQITTANQISDVRNMLEKLKPQLSIALPKHLDTDRVVRIVLTSIQLNPELLNCSKESLLGAVVEASQLGLECDGKLGHAYLIPYKRKGTPTCQLIIGYKGLLELARRSGEIATIRTDVVKANDAFDYELGLTPVLKHKPLIEGDRGKVVFVYAIADLTNGASQFEVMSREEIEAIKSRSRSSGSGPWVTDWEMMAKKTVLRRLCKLLPASVELQTAVSIDERDDKNIVPINYSSQFNLPQTEMVVEPPARIESLEDITQQMKESE
jgi:recombination protein RecT